jgi:hypothetical protein
MRPVLVVFGSSEPLAHQEVSLVRLFMRQTFQVVIKRELEKQIRLIAAK